jgi:hypothetical protein
MTWRDVAYAIFVFIIVVPAALSFAWLLVKGLYWAW